MDAARTRNIERSNVVRFSPVSFPSPSMYGEIMLSEDRGCCYGDGCMKYSRFLEGVRWCFFLQFLALSPDFVYFLRDFSRLFFVDYSRW